MRRLTIFICVVLFALGLTAQEAARPLPVSGFTDEGVFSLYKNESKVGTISYSLTGEGIYTRIFKLSMAGQTVEMFMEVTFDPQGLWDSISIEVPSEVVTVKRGLASAEYRVKSKDATFKVDLAPDHILYDNYGPLFESIMIRNYDMDKGGKQTFSRYLVPSTMMDCDLEFKEKVTRNIQGENREFFIYDFLIAGIPVQFWADATGKIYLMDVPIQYAAFVLEGYEDLMKKEDGAAGILSGPEYDVEKETVMVPMRDGVKLATDIYRPGTDQKVPVILIRTPYKNDMAELEGNFWASRGYATAIQDCRGRFGSEGTWTPFIHEAKDGYDTIEWLAAQNWSSGKVGMIGGSYVGWVQLWAASEKPPHLATIIPNVAPPDPFYNIPYEYGTFFILGSIWWAEILETEATADLSGLAISKISERKYEEILKKLPVIDLDRHIFEKENPYWREWIRHNSNDSYWESANFMEKLETLEIPVFLQSGWFDGDGIGSKLNYRYLKETGQPIKLILGPWGHTSQSTTRIGDYDFGEEAAMDLQTLYIRWFDYWLKGIQNGIMDEPLVHVFTMFSNRWLTGDTYPLSSTEFKKLYLSSDKGANTSRGDGTLVWDITGTDREFDKYTYDPGDPTPWPSYYYKSKQDLEEEKKGTVDIEKRRERIKAFHNSVTDKRKDILVYQTQPLTEPLTIAGPMSAEIYASSTARDTDWFATIMDVDDNGEILQLARGTLRARFRNGTSEPEFLEKKKIYRYTIDLWQTGITFQKGHRIRVEIASALFPAFSRNLNTGGHNEMDTKYVKARQQIYHTPEYPSHILLPVIEMETGGQTGQ